MAKIIPLSITIRARTGAILPVRALSVALLMLAAVTAVAAPPTPAWQLEYRLSGGFTGISIKINLDADGHFLRKDELSYKLIERKLPATQLAPITDAVLALAEAEKAPPPPKTICNDCFRYELTLTINGQRRSYHHQSGLDAPDALLKLIQALQPLTGV